MTSDLGIKFLLCGLLLLFYDSYNIQYNDQTPNNNNTNSNNNNNYNNNNNNNNNNNKSFNQSIFTMGKHIQ